jgi:hypothetical protein
MLVLATYFRDCLTPSLSRKLTVDLLEEPTCEIGILNCLTLPLKLEDGGAGVLHIVKT